MPGALRTPLIGDLDPLGLARTISRIGIPELSVATFQWQDGILQNAWQSWLKTRFLPVFAPHFCSVHQLAGEGKAQEVCTLDLALTALLTTEEGERSRVAGSAFLDTKSGIRGERVWTRFAESVRTAQCPGNLTSFFALQTALFQLPLLTALTTYAWFELECGSSVSRFRDSGEQHASIAPVFVETLTTIRLALEPNQADSAQAAPFLRSI